MPIEARQSTMFCNALNYDPHAIDAAVRQLTQDIRHRELLCRERRSESRLPFHRPVQVTALDEDAGAFGGDLCSITAFTRDVSASGVGLLHDHPLHTRRALLTFELLHGEQISLVVELTWCRYVGDFWYSSGGELVAVAGSVQCPVSQVPEYDLF